MRTTDPLKKDRIANRRELRRARNFVLGCEGPGIARAAARLDMSPSYLSQLLLGTRVRRLTVSELRRLRMPQTDEHATPTVASVPPSDDVAI